MLEQALIGLILAIPVIIIFEVSKFLKNNSTANKFNDFLYTTKGKTLVTIFVFVVIAYIVSVALEISTQT